MIRAAQYPITRRKLLTYLAILPAIVAGGIVGAIEKPIAISVPLMTFAPVGGGTATVTVSVRVPKNAQNRRIAVILDGEVYRSWEEDWIGLEAPSQGIWAIPGLPVGAYTATAILVQAGEDGKTRQLVDTQEFSIQ